MYPLLLCVYSLPAFRFLDIRSASRENASIRPS